MAASRPDSRMRKKIPPTVEPSPAAPPPLRADPQERWGAPDWAQPFGPPRRRRSFLGLLLRVLVALLVLALLPIVALRWVPPPTTAFMLQSPTKPVQYRWVAAPKIAPVLRRAAVAAEDQKFWEHDGFDLEAIEKAREHNRRSKRRRGASTISQQTAKNLFLWPGGGYFRKGVEAGFTMLIETLWSKDRILEVYLNVAEFGPGIYGAEAAARAFFDKPAARLTAEEAARLVAVLPSPRKWSARNPGPYVQARTHWILGQIGYGSPQPRDEAEPLPPEFGDEAAPEFTEPPEPTVLEQIPPEDAVPVPASPLPPPAEPSPEALPTEPEPAPESVEPEPADPVEPQAPPAEEPPAE